MINRTNKIKENFPELLKKSLGIVTNACKAANINRETYYSWRNKDPEFAAACDAAQEFTGDFVESKLLKLIDQEDTSAVIFYCKTKLKNRGYIERREQTGKDGAPVEYNFNFHQLTKEQKDDIVKIRHEQ